MSGTPRCIWPGKTKHKTKAKANHSAKIQNNKTSSADKITAYPCGDHYHTGKVSAPKKSAAKANIEDYFGRTT